MPETVKVHTESFRTDDFDELQDASAYWDQRYDRLAPGSFQGRIDLTQVGSTHIFRERWSRKFRYRGLTPCDTYAFALPIAQPGPFNWVGAAGCLDTVFIQAPGKEADLVSSEYLDALILAISKEQVHSTVAALSDMDHLFDERHATIKLAPERAAHLRQLGKAILAPAMQESASDPIETKFWSEQLVKLYLWEVVRTCERFSPVAAPARSAILVQSATELVLSGPAGGIGLTEICAEFGVSLRTLHYAFQDVTGLSPATWLRRIRLNRVHKALLQGSPEETQVKGIAMKEGFYHLGHFGQQYQKLFGCLPSETLRAS